MAQTPTVLGHRAFRSQGLAFLNQTTFGLENIRCKLTDLSS